MGDFGGNLLRCITVFNTEITDITDFYYGNYGAFTWEIVTLKSQNRAQKPAPPMINRFQWQWGEEGIYPIPHPILWIDELYCCKHFLLNELIINIEVILQPSPLPLPVILLLSSLEGNSLFWKLESNLGRNARERERVSEWDNEGNNSLSLPRGDSQAPIGTLIFSPYAAIGGCRQPLAAIRNICKFFFFFLHPTPPFFWDFCIAIFIGEVSIFTRPKPPPLHHTSIPFLILNWKKLFSSFGTDMKMQFKWNFPPNALLSKLHFQYFIFSFTSSCTMLQGVGDCPGWAKGMKGRRRRLRYSHQYNISNPLWAIGAFILQGTGYLFPSLGVQRKDWKGVYGSRIMQKNALF